MTIKQILFSGFFMLVGAFFLNFFIYQKLSSEVVAGFNDLNQSEQVIRNSNMLHKIMIDMQNSFRGYLLTGQESFLQPYNEGLTTVPKVFNEQLSLVVRETQKRHLDTIGKLHKKWVEYADALISAKMDTLPEASAKYIELFEKKLKVEVGKKINDQIKLRFIALDKAEYKLRQERRITLRDSIVRTRNISILLTILSIAVAIFFCFFIIRIIIERINKMAHYAKNISLGNFTNINDRKNDEFQKLSVSLNTMSMMLSKSFIDLTDKNRELDQFAYVVSHDLKAPLHGIMSLIAWIAEDHENELSPDLAKKIKLIDGRARRLDNMINGLLDYARIGKANENLTSVNMEIMLKELADMLVPDSFSVIIDKGMPTLVTEKLRLEQVFANLISNAVKYNDKARGEIRIGARRMQKYYEFSVSDNGPGIPPEYHEKIFMMFQTLTERDAFESTGIGLAIVKKIIDDQKSSIRIETNAGGGATFKFTWPIQSSN